ncbi:MAG: hypothetical protein COT88_01255 [Candidatus Colwellbacteria bacterium CG10_big_fil_rev_8_21_14_0_10_41_28]|uniref:Uncharacterized protein n=1 Tax=Candidatus Colwellbacteria bacterium CG10_big_fil_rev_8_21_14_0_10_41_28 TaxID=1974539 RepID=A0A2H0VH50_9BACT|nr:MAG: hypothetical protein COT88_01255 [Candidatus Colwellbacteria bacterium CG10_big_fil_rev_8_21_14_0_10_41_28]
MLPLLTALIDGPETDYVCFVDLYFFRTHKGACVGVFHSERKTALLPLNNDHGDWSRRPSLIEGNHLLSVYWTGNHYTIFFNFDSDRQVIHLPIGCICTALRKTFPQTKTGLFFERRSALVWIYLLRFAY